MWHFRFLGSLSAERDGGATLALPARKYTALLGLLVLHPARRWTRDELVALFWPDADEQTGRAALRTALSTLRTRFGPEWESTHGNMVGVASNGFTTDAAQFVGLLEKAGRAHALPDQEARLLNDALSLYQGPLLPGIYDDWAMGERERLEAAHEKAQNRLGLLQKNAARESEQEASHERFLRKAGGPFLVCLPLYNTAFVGREADLERIADLLCGDPRDRARLVTLTGPGGMGKTRTAVEAAKIIAGRFSGAVCFVSLAALTGGDEMGVALVEALQMDGTGQGTDALAQALFRLDDLGPSLLVLDNMEQLVDAGAAQVVRTLLARLPQITLLATSRRLLGVEGEQEYPLSPLDAEPCAQLFLEHARAARSDYGAGDGETLRALCSQLEGIPLAIELCAPWVRVLSDEQMLDHLSHRFSLLTSRRKDITPRHRSLHAALLWGCPTDPDLLHFFAALSVFRGGWTLPAAQAVGGDHALHHLAALREQSLVLADAPPQGGGSPGGGSPGAGSPGAGSPGAMRFRMLETIREFACEKLTDETEKAARRSSLAYYKYLACDLAPRLAGGDTAGVFAALEAESANFRAALEWGIGDTPESLLLACDLMNELRWFWNVRGHRLPFDQWRRVACQRRSELPDPHRTDLTLQYALYHAPEAERETLLSEALAHCEAVSYAAGVIHAHEHLAALYRAEHRHEAMEAHYRAAARLHQSANDRRGYGYVLANLAGAFFEVGRVADARPLWEECRHIAAELGDVGGQAVLNRAEAVAFLNENRSAAALPLLEAAADTFRHKGETRQLLDTLCQLGRAHEGAANLSDAQAAWTEAVALARQCGDAGRVEMLGAWLSPHEAAPSNTGSFTARTPRPGHHGPELLEPT